MKKNLPLIIIVAVLIAILAFLRLKQTNSSYNQAEFNIADVNTIGSIELSDKNGGKTTLNLTKEGWKVDDTILAEKNKIIILLETINRLEIELPVSDTMRSRAIEDLRMFGTKVLIKDNDGDEIKTIYVGNSTPNGNYMILSQDGKVGDQPFLVKLPGMQQIDLKHRFIANSSQWYSTEVFAVKADKLKEVKIEFTEYPNFSFIMTKDEQLIQINPLVDSVKIDKPLNREHILQFLLEFEQKHFESRIKEDSFIKIIKTLKPHSKIEVTDVFDKKKSIILYRIPALYAKTGKDAMGNDLPFSIEKYWAYLPHTKEYVLAQHYVFGPILLPYSSYFEIK